MRGFDVCFCFVDRVVPQSGRPRFRPCGGYLSVGAPGNGRGVCRTVEQVAAVTGEVFADGSTRLGIPAAV